MAGLEKAVCTWYYKGLNTFTVRPCTLYIRVCPKFSDYSKNIGIELTVIINAVFTDFTDLYFTLSPLYCITSQKHPLHLVRTWS